MFPDDTWQEKEKEIRYNEIYQEIKSARKKNSDIDLYLSSTTDIDIIQSEKLKKEVECRGFLPDIWAFTEEEIYKTLLYIQK